MCVCVCVSRSNSPRITDLNPNSNLGNETPFGPNPLLGDSVQKRMAATVIATVVIGSEDLVN